jgi:glycosyltransferase involved in cell wall biosynthesis
MNIHRSHHTPAASLPAPASAPATPLAENPAVDDLLQRLARQTRRIQSLERLIAMGGKPSGGPTVVKLTMRLPRTPAPVPVAPRAAARTWPSWPGKPMPQRAMEPPPGGAHLALRGKGAKVIAFAVFGLSDDQLEREVERVSEQQALQGNFIPLFLTQSRNTEPFRRRGYVFEYFPAVDKTGASPIIEELQSRLDFIESKWGIDHFINLAQPVGSPIRDENRPPRERYLEAKARLSSGRFAPAQRVLGEFTRDSLAGAKVSVFGPQAAQPSASIVVVSHRDHPGVEEGLRSIAGQMRPGQFEVILVDNGNSSLAQLGRKIFAACKVVDVGFNAGCSGARNLGASLAKAPFVMFLDDDGIAEEGCVEALLGCILSTGAVAVRGRVKPLTEPHLKGSHYDLGDARIPALATCEGVSVWQRGPFLSAGGFDPLLAGHEGMALCARLWRFHGPAAFVYEPSAVLLHDYAPNAGATAAKNKRYRQNMDYLNFLGLRWQEVNAGQMRFLADPMLGYLALQAPRRLATPSSLTVSVITTAKNAQPFLSEYTAALKAQTSPDFEVIFVDDNSDDDTSEEIARLWAGDPRIKVFKNTGRGRGAALNEALRHASGEICIIADVDDLSVPCRVAMTRSGFAQSPELDCLSFVAFNESNPFRLGPPRSLFVDDLGVRQFFGMPVSFPTFAFRRQSFPQPFDAGLRGGIDCDWWFRNVESSSIRGQVLFYPAVYYREHAGQITSTQKHHQLAVRRQHVASVYAGVLGQLEPRDHRYIQVLTETKQIPSSEKNMLASWVAHLLQKNRELGLSHAEHLDQAMFEVLREVDYVKGK